MLSAARTHATLPVADLDRARRFYEQVLGFTPSDIRPAGVFYDAGDGTRFFLFPSGGRPSGDHTQIGFQVADIDREVADLRARGVTFEVYDMPTFDRDTMIATFPVNRSAWFKDTEGNLIGIVQLS
jgi:catechol 2,3-dioxygenase-like lactoylglutathione lyase family enzyme